MEPIIIVEILEKSGKVHERSKLAHFPATFGRAYDNDLILNDPFVSPQHARISLDENGALTLIDLGTENGTHCLPQMQPVSSIALGADTLLRMGQTLVRLRRPDYAVAPTRIDKLTNSRTARCLTSPATLAILSLLLFGLLGLNSYQSSAQAKTVGQLLLENIEIVVLIPVWAGIWALLSRIFMHHAAYISHAVIASLGVIGFLCANVLVEYYAFGFSALLTADILLHILLGLLACAMLYGHLRFTTLFSPRRIGVIAIATAVGLVGLSGLTTYVQSLEFNDTLPYPPELKPPQFQMTPEKSPQDFVRDAGKISPVLDATH